MKKLLSLLLLVSTIAFSQAPPQGISHRGTVYNPSTGAIIVGQVKIRISILDGSSTGTSVYSEFYSTTTNNQGQYSLNIGTSATFSASTPFNTINWGSNSKYLKVEIDPTNTATFTSPSSSFSISGSNQLMSVPYALYAQSSSNFETINTIAALRTYLNFSDNKIVYVKGYYNEGDGGEGFFIYKSNGFNTTAEASASAASPEADNGGTIIQTTNSTTSGRWFRQYNGYLNALFFGVVKDIYPSNIPNSFSNSARIQAAIDYVSNNTIYNSSC